MKKMLFSLVAVLSVTSQTMIVKAAKSAEVTMTLENTKPLAAPASMEETGFKDAMALFKNLSKSERKDRIRAAKKEIKHYKSAKKNHAEPSTDTLLLVILAILLPPLAVYLHQGEINNKFWLSLILTLLFFIPGVIYALIVVLGDE